MDNGKFEVYLADTGSSSKPAIVIVAIASDERDLHGEYYVFIREPETEFACRCHCYEKKSNQGNDDQSSFNDIYQIIVDFAKECLNNHLHELSKEPMYSHLRNKSYTLKHTQSGPLIRICMGMEFKEDLKTIQNKSKCPALTEFLTNHII